MNEFVLKLLFLVIFLFPMWIWIVSIKPMSASKKKIMIVAMAIISTGISIYGLIRPNANSSLSWIGQAALVIYFVAVVVSAYFYWPHDSSEYVLARNKMRAKLPRKISSMKDKNYILIPVMNGTDGNASVSFINATFQKVNESVKRFPDPDFGAWLIEQIYYKERTFAERQGVFRKKLLCPSCGTELNPNFQASKRIEYQLKYKDFDPFIIQITIPTVICSQCNKISGIDLDGSLNNHLSEAIITAFKSENIKP